MIATTHTSPWWTQEYRHGLCEARTYGTAGVAHLSRLYELRTARNAWRVALAVDVERAGQPAFIKRALELGVNFFDTANVYSNGDSEAILGRAIKDFTRRDEVVIATKVWGPVRNGPNGRGLSRKAILSEVDKSLQRLGTDYLDLYWIHRFDYETP